MGRYDEMTYRRCGRSGLKLPLLSLGLWHNFGDKDDQDVASKLITGAFDLGITHFDLANNYGPPPGSAEKNFGRIFKKNLSSHRHELVISTKAGYTMWDGPYGDWGSRKYMLNSLDMSLERMGLDYVDVFYSHRYDPETPLEETMGALDHAVRSGKALYAGISNYPASETGLALEILKDLGTPCLVYQGKYNMLHRDLEGMLDHILEVGGVGLTVFSPLAQGVLTDRYLKGIPSDSRAARNIFLKPDSLTKERLVQLVSLNRMAQERNQSLAAMSLNWIMKHQGVSSIIIGASRPDQLKDNISALGSPPLTNEELKKIDTILEMK